MSTFRPGGDPATLARRSLPERPSLEQLHKEAKDLLRAARRGDAAALTRMAAITRAAPRTRIITGGRAAHDRPRIRVRELAQAGPPHLPEEGAQRGLSLWIAVNDRQHEIAGLLLAHGADANAEVESSGTPMSQAAGDAELTELLRAHGGRQQTSDRDRVARLIEKGDLAEAERLLRANPQWIQDHEAGWGDGILAGPAHDGP